MTIKVDLSSLNISYEKKCINVNWILQYPNVKNKHHGYHDNNGFLIICLYLLQQSNNRERSRNGRSFSSGKVNSKENGITNEKGNRIRTA